MLDDQNIIKQRDPFDALGIAAKQSEQLQISADISDFKLESVQNIILAGMGGSALVGLIVKAWLGDELTIPFEIVHNYQLPNYVSKNTLVIASSYSGNTEETIATFEDAHAKGAQVVALTAGGTLLQKAQQYDYAALNLPTGYQPRMAVWFSVKLIAQLFDQLQLTKDAVKRLDEARAKVQQTADKYTAQIPTAQNPAKQLAEHLVGKLIFVYSGPTLSSIAYKWKIDFNENSKNLASYNEFPEFNHNEMLGWIGQPVEKPFGVVELQSSFDVERIKKRFAITNKLLSGRMPKPYIIEAEGETKLEQLLNTLILGDFTSLYLAILNGVNPLNIDLIEKLKRDLA